MKYLIILAMITFAKSTTAQVKQVITKDSLKQRLVIKNMPVSRKAVSSITVKAEIENELNKIVTAYLRATNTAATWVKIKDAAENLLHSYFKSGKLLGNNATEAYIVKIGNDTMTKADINNHKIILVAGVAIFKPADFEIIRIEKTLSQ